MTSPPTRPDEPIRAPQPYRDAMAELVQAGMSVIRLIQYTADTERALAQAANGARAAEGASPLAASLAEAIEADQAAAAAAEARLTVVERVEALGVAFTQVARGVHRTVLLAERLDRGWAQGRAADDSHAMAQRQIARGVADALARHTQGQHESEHETEPSSEQAERAETLTEACDESLAPPNTLDNIGNGPAAAVYRNICRDLRVDPARMPPVPSDPAPPGLEPAASPITRDASPHLNTAHHETNPWSRVLQKPPFVANARASPPDP